MSDVPPRPSDIIPEQSDCKMQYQGMTELSNDEYKRLAEDIRERGVLQPIIVDSENRIIDGHHREALAQHLELDDARAPAYITLADLDGKSEKIARGIKQNLIGRDTTDAVKTHAVKQYIETAWDRTDGGDLIRPETDSEVAEKLGVSVQTVGRVLKKFHVEIIYHDRVAAREYYEANPDASYREVARQVGASWPTVTEWLKEDFDEGDDDQSDDKQDTPLNVFSRDEDERDTANEIAQTANEDSDSEATEEASAAVEELAKGETSPDEAKEAVNTAESEESEMTQTERQQNTEETPELPEKDYDLIVADPPWRYDFSKTANREVENHYATMTLTDIKELELPATEDAVLYLWTTAPKAHEAHDVIDAWGFEYKTQIIWDKVNIGMGYWARSRHETLLVATRGDVSPPEPEDREHSILAEKRTEHSSKPDCVNDMIAEQHPNAEIIEMFARDSHESFETWGAEASDGMKSDD